MNANKRLLTVHYEILQSKVISPRRRISCPQSVSLTSVQQITAKW